MLRLQRELNIPSHPVELRMSGILKSLPWNRLKILKGIGWSSSIFHHRHIHDEVNIYQRRLLSYRGGFYICSPYESLN